MSRRQLTDANLRNILINNQPNTLEAGTSLVERPWPTSMADHTKPNTKKSNSIVTPAINNLSGELTSML